MREGKSGERSGKKSVRKFCKTRLRNGPEQRPENGPESRFLAATVAGGIELRVNLGPENWSGSGPEIKI